MVRQNIYSFNSSTIRFGIEYSDAYRRWHGRSFTSFVVYSVDWLAQTQASKAKY